MWISGLLRRKGNINNKEIFNQKSDIWDLYKKNTKGRKGGGSIKKSVSGRWKVARRGRKVEVKEVKRRPIPKKRTTLLGFMANRDR